MRIQENRPAGGASRPEIQDGQVTKQAVAFEILAESRDVKAAAEYRAGRAGKPPLDPACTILEGQGQLQRFAKVPVGNRRAQPS